MTSQNDPIVILSQIENSFKPEDQQSSVVSSGDEEATNDFEK